MLLHRSFITITNNWQDRASCAETISPHAQIALRRLARRERSRLRPIARTGSHRGRAQRPRDSRRRRLTRRIRRRRQPGRPAQSRRDRHHLHAAAGRIRQQDVRDVQWRVLLVRRTASGGARSRLDRSEGRVHSERHGAAGRPRAGHVGVSLRGWRAELARAGPPGTWLRPRRDRGRSLGGADRRPDICDGQSRCWPAHSSLHRRRTHVRSGGDAAGNRRDRRPGAERWRRARSALHRARSPPPGEPRQPEGCLLDRALDQWWRDVQRAASGLRAATVQRRLHPEAPARREHRWRQHRHLCRRPAFGALS